MIIENLFFLCLLITLAIEVPILIFISKYVFKFNFKLQKLIVIGIIASILTLPYLWFLFPAYIKFYYILIGEIMVILVEALIYNQLLEIKYTKSLFISIIVNFISYFLGNIILYKII